MRERGGRESERERGIERGREGGREGREGGREGEREREDNIIRPRTPDDYTDHCTRHVMQGHQLSEKIIFAAG